MRKFLIFTIMIFFVCGNIFAVEIMKDIKNDSLKWKSSLDSSFLHLNSPIRIPALKVTFKKDEIKQINNLTNDIDWGDNWTLGAFGVNNDYNYYEHHLSSAVDRQGDQWLCFQVTAPPEPSEIPPSPSTLNVAAIVVMESTNGGGSWTYMSFNVSSFNVPSEWNWDPDNDQLKNPDIAIGSDGKVHIWMEFHDYATSDVDMVFVRLSTDNINDPNLTLDLVWFGNGQQTDGTAYYYPSVDSAEGYTFSAYEYGTLYNGYGPFAYLMLMYKADSLDDNYWYGTYIGFQSNEYKLYKPSVTITSTPYGYVASELFYTQLPGYWYINIFPGQLSLSGTETDWTFVSDEWDIIGSLSGGSYSWSNNRLPYAESYNTNFVTNFQAYRTQPTPTCWDTMTYYHVDGYTQVLPSPTPITVPIASVNALIDDTDQKFATSYLYGTSLGWAWYDEDLSTYDKNAYIAYGTLNEDGNDPDISFPPTPTPFVYQMNDSDSATVAKNLRTLTVMRHSSDWCGYWADSRVQPTYGWNIYFDCENSVPTPPPTNTPVVPASSSTSLAIIIAIFTVLILLTISIKKLN